MAKKSKYPTSFVYTPAKVSAKKKVVSKPKSVPKPKPKPPKLTPYFIDFKEDRLTSEGDSVVRAFIVDATGAEVSESSGFGLNRRTAKEDLLRRCKSEVLLKLFE